MWSGRVSFAIPIAAVVAFAAMLGWFGWARLKPGAAPDAPAEMVARTPSGKPSEPGAAPPTAQIAPAAPQRAAQATLPAGRSTPDTGGPAPQAGLPSPAAVAGGAPAPAASGAAPSFDIVRVEPSGDSVIAGRAAPRGRVKLLDNGREIAALAADESGQFVIVPPPLAPGSHELVLQVEGQDAAATASPQSVTVVVAEARNQPPLVTLTVPGRPSVILSRPDAPPPAAVASRTDGVRPAEAGAATSAGLAGAVPGRPGAAPAPSATPRIVSVESEGAGRLYVSGTVAPSASVRLYLNDAFVAAAAAGADGRLAFAIESGIRPGDYRVRLDVVDGATGAVLSRAEAPFAMPAAAAVAGGPAIPLPPPAPGRPVVVAAASPTPTPTAATPTAGQAASVPLGLSGAASGTRTPASAPFAAGVPQPAATAVQPMASAIGAAGSPSVPSATTPSAALAAPPSGFPSATGQPALSASAPAGPSGGAARVAETAAPAAGVTVVPEVNTAIVSRGESLWQISKRTYGSGLRYTVIFGANTPQIRDPDLIYPGQVFVLPTGQPITVTR